MAAIKRSGGGDRSSPVSKRQPGKLQAGSQMLPALPGVRSRGAPNEEPLTRRSPGLAANPRGPCPRRLQEVFRLFMESGNGLGWMES